MKVVFRADGNVKVGYGHFFRCLSFAEKLSGRFNIQFACSSPDSFVKEQLSSGGGIDLIELPAYEQYPPDDERSGTEIVFDLGGIICVGDIVVVDGYRFGTTFRKAVKDAGAYLICVDDDPKGFYPADIIIDPSPAGASKPYERADSTVLLGGLQYALLRSLFAHTPIAPGSSRMGFLVSMGGSDFYNITPRVVETLLQQTGENISVVTTRSFAEANRSRLQALSDSHPDRVMICRDLNAIQMVGEMDKAKYGIVASSTVLLEALKRGLTVGFGYYANNQLSYYNYFKSRFPDNALGNLCDPVSMPSNLKETVLDFDFLSPDDWVGVFNKLIDEDPINHQ